MQIGVENEKKKNVVDNLEKIKKKKNYLKNPNFCQSYSEDKKKNKNFYVKFYIKLFFLI